MANPKIVKQWFAYAGRDLRAAQALFDLSSEYKSFVAFSCQQCVEKSIKGYLVFHGVRPPKTHALKDLAEAVAAVDPKLSNKLKKANKLTKFAVAYRYPDTEKKPLTTKQVNSALKMAKQIFKIMIDEINK